jgi:hypothetical protein
MANDIRSTLTGPKDSGSGSPGGNATSPAENQKRLQTNSGFFGDQMGGKYEWAGQSSISGNLGGTTNTEGSEDNAPNTFSGITVEPPHMPPGISPAANEQP